MENAILKCFFTFYANEARHVPRLVKSVHHILNKLFLRKRNLAPTCQKHLASKIWSKIFLNKKFQKWANKIVWQTRQVRPKVVVKNWGPKIMFQNYGLKNTGLEIVRNLLTIIRSLILTTILEFLSIIFRLTGNILLNRKFNWNYREFRLIGN